LICIREDHRGTGEAVNTIVAVPFDGSSDTGELLIQGNDFYSSPKLSPDGTHLAWLTWNHPNMPWDGCELWVGEVTADGAVENVRWMAGGSHESIFQPEWSPSGVLYFSSDRNGWWNLQRIGEAGQIESICPIKGELGTPQWLFGMSFYAFASDDLIVCSHIEQGISRLALLDLQTKKLQEIDCPFTDIQYLQASNDYAVFRAGSPTEVAAIARLNLTTKQIETLRLSNDLDVFPAYFSIPRPIEFPTEAGLTAHGFFYPPQNPDYEAPENEKPPLIVKSHGAQLPQQLQHWRCRFSIGPREDLPCWMSTMAEVVAMAVSIVNV
jgi:dipeptidyl aminopeptidase/acylaminoacyl peptidase